eukprot:2065565-Pyramimonas_sp.AAC.1
MITLDVPFRALGMPQEAHAWYPPWPGYVKTQGSSEDRRVRHPLGWPGHVETRGTWFQRRTTMLDTPQGGLDT